MANPFVSHFQVATPVLRYLKTFSEQGILFLNSSHLKLHRFIDFDWAWCPIPRNQSLGIVCYLATHLFCGVLISRTQWQDPLLKQNIESWFPWLVRYNGYLNFLQLFTSIFLHLRLSIATVNLPSTLGILLPFTSEANKLSWIVVSFGKSYSQIWLICFLSRLILSL